MKCVPRRHSPRWFATILSFVLFLFVMGCSDISEPLDQSEDVSIGGDVSDVKYDALPDTGTSEFNGCGGLDDLIYDDVPASPGASCGECEEGWLVCTGPESLECIGASERNACGGCGVLPGEEDEACRACGDGA